MFNIGDYVVHKKTICKIIEIKENYFKGSDYYILKSLKDDTLKISVPVDSNILRRPLSKEEVEEMIDNIPNIEPIVSNDRFIENEYRELLNNNNHEDLIRIIKTTYLRNKERLDNNKKISSKDNEFFELAENYLYNEFAIALGLSFDETKEYVINRVASIA